MAPLRVLIGYQIDQDYSLAQHPIVREVGARLDPEVFHLTAFYDRVPDQRFVQRPNTRLIRLPPRLRSVVRMRVLMERFDRCWYLAPEPSSYGYLKLRPRTNVAVTSVEGHVWDEAFATVPGAVRRYLNALIVRSRRLTAVSHEIADELLARYGRKAEVIPVGVDTDLFRPGAQTNGLSSRPSVLFVGALQPWKRPELVIEAAARFPEADFTLVGQGPLRGELERNARQRGLSNVRFGGVVTHEALADLYRRSSAFLFPSRSEGSPKVLLEAAASGVPAVTFGEYEPEAVEDGVTGFVTRSEADMMGALSRLIEGPSVGGDLGANARSRAQQWSWHVVAARWAEVLLEPLPAARP